MSLTYSRNKSDTPDLQLPWLWYLPLSLAVSEPDLDPDHDPNHDPVLASIPDVGSQPVLKPVGNSTIYLLLIGVITNTMLS